MFFKNEYPAYFFTSDSTRLFYSTNFELSEFSSEKPLVVFNYGLVCNNNHWKHQLPFFDNLGFQILIYDYRAHFNSSGQDRLNELNFNILANDLFELLDQLKPTSVYMLGHSMGVNVTLEFARKFPGLVKAMVLISGTVVPPQDVMFDSNIVDIISPYLEWFSKNYPDAYKALWQTSFMNPLARQAIFHGGFNTKKVPMEFIEVYMNNIGKLHPNIFFTLLNAMRDHDVINHLEDIMVPALIMGGDKDKIIPNYLQTILSDHLKLSEVYIIKDGSHVPQADFPETVNERILYFLNNLD